CVTARAPEGGWRANPNVGLLLVGREPAPEDRRGMRVARGIPGALGGGGPHAALVSRQMGKVCIVGCSELVIDYHAGTVACGGKTLREGDSISIDGFTGEVFAGHVTTQASEVIQVLLHKTLGPEQSETFQRYAQLMKWVDDARRLRVRTNADQPDQAREAIAFGAEGIGLCRTEHMFFDHIDEFREMILAGDVEARQAALQQLIQFLWGQF